MGRWEPNAQVRLRQAAMELYGERGFDQTTVAEIAERAGLTERTFFRHFTDKREVFFAGSSRLEEFLIAAVGSAAPERGPASAVAAAFETVAADYFPPVDHSRRRQALLAANPPLMERELAKLDRLAAALTRALRTRGVTDPAAALAAEAGVAAFKVAFARWLADPADGPLVEHMREAFGELRKVLAQS